MAKRRRFEGRNNKGWSYGQRKHFRRRIAAWRNRGFSEAEVRQMAHNLRSAGPGYVGMSAPRAELEHDRAHNHNVAGNAPGGNHTHRNPGPAYTPPEKHHSKYRAKHRG